MTDSFRRACLIAAVVVGCAFSAFRILHDVRVPVSFLPGVAARVNGREIDADSINRTVAGMDARDRRSESATRRDVLTRMIDEELLVQHALDSGAAESSPEVRAALVRSAITRVNAEAAAEPISDREVEDYFRSHSEVYATSARFDVTPLYFESTDAPDGAAAMRALVADAQSRAPDAGAAIGDGRGRAADARAAMGDGRGRAADARAAMGDGRGRAADARAAMGDGRGRAADARAAMGGGRGRAAQVRANEARAAIRAGEPLEQVANTADGLPFAAPSSQVTARTLANYFGPATAAAVDSLAAGETTNVIQLGSGALFIYVNQKIPGAVPTLATVHDLVAADALRARQEQALDILLVSLHRAARIEVASSPDAFDTPASASSPRSNTAAESSAAAGQLSLNAASR